MDFEDILTQVGDFGRYQKKLLFLFLAPAIFLAPIARLTTFFHLSAPEHWCFVPQLAHFPHDVQQQLMPKTMRQGLPATDNCHYYDIDYDHLLTLFNGSLQINGNLSSLIGKDVEKKRCDKWVYDTTNYEANAVTEAGTTSGILHIHNRGYNFLWFAHIFPRDLRYAAFRFLNSFFMSVGYQFPYLLVTELMGPEPRSKVGGWAALMWTFGYCALPLIAYLSRTWVMLTIVSALAVVPLFGYWKMLPESPRWLISRGRYAEAHDIMVKIADENGREVPSDLMSQLKKVGEKDKELEKKERFAFLQLITRPGLRLKFVLIVFAWMANTVTYRGLTLNFKNFVGNEFFNFFLLALVEFPASFAFWYLMDTRLGRRWSYCLCSIVGGIFLCLPALMPPEWPIGVTAASLAGKFACVSAFNIMYQHAIELFPTSLRTTGMGASRSLATVGTLWLPYLAQLGDTNIWVPLLVMGLFAVSSGITVVFLPETLYENLPQTVEEAVTFGKNFKILTLAKTKEQRKAELDLKVKPLLHVNGSSKQ